MREGTFVRTPRGPRRDVRGIGLAGLLAGLLLSLSGCPQPVQDAQVLVVVNGKPISLEDFNRRWAALSPSLQARYRAMGGERKFLDELIGEELLLQEGRRQGLDQGAAIREQMERLKEQLMLDELMKQALQSTDEVGDADVEAYVAAHPEAVRQPQVVHLAHIVVATQDMAKDIKRRLDQGHDFGVQARKFSIDVVSRAKGGELGVYREGEGPAEVEKEFLHLKVGGVSEPIQTDKGFRIVKLLAREPEDQKKKALAKARLKQELQAERRRKRFEVFQAKLRANASVRMADASKLVVHDASPPPATTPQ